MYTQVYIQNDGSINTDSGDYTNYFIKNENGVDAIYAENGSYSGYYFKDGILYQDDGEVPTEYSVEGGKVYGPSEKLPWE